MREVYEALGSPTILAIDVAVDHKTCPVEGAVVAELGAMYRATEAFMLEQMQEVTLGTLAIRAT